MLGNICRSLQLTSICNENVDLSEVLNHIYNSILDICGFRHLKAYQVSNAHISNQSDALTVHFIRVTFDSMDLG